MLHPQFERYSEGIGAGLFQAESCFVETDLELAHSFRQRLIDAASRGCFATARYAFHSGRSGVDELIWRYIGLALKVGPRLGTLLATDPVLSVSRIARQVAHEAHKFKGFVRFRELKSGFLYASIEPQADILELIAPHFADRIGNSPWMIHDLGRQAAMFCEHGRWRQARGIALEGAADPTAEEAEFSRLWQRYFQRMAIQERMNPGLQQQHVPLRVRTHLTEFQTVQPIW